MKEFRFNVFGRLIAIRCEAGERRTFELGAEGKRRPADFIVPDDVADEELCEYLFDLFHEDATPRNHSVTQIG